VSQSARLTAICALALVAWTQGAGFTEKEQRREAERREAQQRRTETDRQDSELEASLARAERDADGAGGQPREAFEFAELVIKSYDSESVKSGRVVPSAFAERAAASLDLAIAADKAQSAALLWTKGKLWRAAGNAELAEAAFRASLVARPRLDALLEFLQAFRGRLSPAEVKGLCNRTRPYVATDEERFALFEASLRYGRSVSVEGGLSWTSREDLVWYKREAAERAERKRAAEESVRLAEEQCRIEAELHRVQKEREQEVSLRAEAEDRRQQGAP